MRILSTVNFPILGKLNPQETANLEGSIQSLERAGLKATDTLIEALARSIISRRGDGSGTSASGGMGGNLGPD